MTDTWYISRDGKSREGPFSLQQVKTMLLTGQLRPHMLAWRDGQSGWVALGSIAELSPAPPPLPMKTLIEPHTPADPQQLLRSPQNDAQSPATMPTPLPPSASPQTLVVVTSSSPTSTSTAQDAGFLLRLPAIIIDTIIVGTVSKCAEYGLAHGFLAMIRASDGRMSPQEAAPFLYAAVLIASLAIGWIYFAGLESSRRQATLGKLAMGLRVTDERAQRLSFAHATGRHFAKFLSVLTAGVGFLMAIWTRRKQALHDKVAGALVLRGAVPIDV